jgi:hypothetical protein
LVEYLAQTLRGEGVSAEHIIVEADGKLAISRRIWNGLSGFCHNATAWGCVWPWTISERVIPPSASSSTPLSTS